MKAKYLRNRPATFALLCFVGAMSSGAARADVVTIGTTAFAGTDTNYTAVGAQNLPYTDASGRTVNGGQSILNGGGVFVFSFQTLSFTNLATGTHEIGLSLLDQGSDFFIQSVTLSNGDSVTVGTPFENDAFLSFSDPAAFTSATVVFGSDSFGSGFVTDFRTASGVSSVPEPLSLLLLATIMAILITGVRRRFRNTPVF